MGEQLASLLFWLIVLIPVCVFIRQIQQVRSGRRGKVKGTLLFFWFSFVPVLVYVLVFLAMIGVEEVTKYAMIGDGFARIFVLVVGIGLGEVLLLTALFAIVASILHPPRLQSNIMGDRR